MSKRMFGMAMLAATIGLFAWQTAVASTYYVDLNAGGTGSGADWTNAYTSVQAALDGIDTAADANATVYVAKTGGGPTYTSSSKSYQRSTTIDFLGGYNPTTSVRDGVSEIKGSGVGMTLNVDGATSPTTYNGDFRFSHFDIETDNIGLYAPAPALNSRSTSNVTKFTATSSTISTTSTSASPVQMQIYSSGGMMPSLTLDGTTVSTPAGSVSSTVRMIATSNSTTPGVTEVKNGSVVTGAADGTGSGKNAALDVEQTLLVMDGSTVTNTGAGYGVRAGRPSYGAHDYSHQIKNSLITSAGDGVLLQADDFSRALGPVVTPVTTVEGTIITANGAYGLRVYGWHGTGNDSGATDVLVKNSTIINTGDGGVGLTTQSSNGGAMDYDIEGSSIHGKDKAIHLVYNTSGNRGHDTFDIVGSMLSAGATDGSTNSASVVLLLEPRKNGTVTLDGTVVGNGAGGIYLNPGDDALLTMINSVVTDQEGAGYGVRLAPRSDDIVRLTATNSTFSDLDGVPAEFGDNTGAATQIATLKYNAFAPGSVLLDILSNEDPNALTLNGDYNAFYEYSGVLESFGAGGIVNNLTNSQDFSALSAGIGPDGYHLAGGSPLKDVYLLVLGDPTVDIDGEARPFGLLADIGADETTALPIPEPAGLSLVGLTLLALKRRRR